MTPNAAADATELAVLVCTYNRSELLGQSLRQFAAAAASTGVPAEVVVVDDASDDDSAAAALAACPDATVVRHWRNRGAAAARNTAAQAARAPWLLFIDDDMVLDGPAFAALLARREPGTCLVPAVRNKAGELMNAVLGQWRLGMFYTVSQSAPVDEVAYPLSGCLLVHRDLFERAGGFDERFRPNYGEDDAFGFDLARAGGTVRMVGEASVLHNDHGGDTSDEQLLNIAKRQAHHRWVLYLVAVRGWRRVLAVAVGLPRSIQDSIRVRAMYPLWGYLRALLRAPELLRPKPRPGPLAERGEVIGVTQSTR